jgi:hypothetical protein
MKTSPLLGRRFFSYRDLKARGIKFSRTHIRRLENAGLFPMHLALGAGASTQTSKAWVADEVLAWEARRISERDLKINSAAGGLLEGRGALEQQASSPIATEPHRPDARRRRDNLKESRRRRGEQGPGQHDEC